MLIFEIYFWFHIIEYRHFPIELSFKFSYLMEDLSVLDMFFVGTFELLYGSSE